MEPERPADPPIGATAPSGPFALLRQKTFGILWCATVIGNTGTFMRDVASAWLVTDLSGSPATVALVQTAATLPIFLLAIPAGVLSDILDRRRFLIACQIFLGATTLALMLLAQTGLLTVSALVAFTFLGGIGAAMVGPTWQAIVPELVPPPEIKNAVALNSLGINVSRAIGPAAGGALLAAVGATATYAADAFSYIFVVSALLWWPRTAAANNDLSERFVGSFVAGLRYARASRDFRVVLMRAAVFFSCTSVVWALLPLIARDLLEGGASYYGVLLGAVGAGAILGAVLLPWLRTRLDADGLMLLAGLCVAAGMVALAMRPPKSLALATTLVLGIGWIIALTTLNATCQAILPNWVRGRGLAIYLTVFNGAMSAGSLGWGVVSEAMGLVGALLAGSAILLAATFAALRLRLPSGDADLTASNHWPEPLMMAPVAHDRGPVLVLVEYRVPIAERPAFLHAINALSFERRRDGAYAWGIAEDAADAGRLVEWFLVSSWAEHLRQHLRVSVADKDLQEEVARFHAGDEAATVRHLIQVTAELPPEPAPP